MPIPGLSNVTNFVKRSKSDERDARNSAAAQGPSHARETTNNAGMTQTERARKAEALRMPVPQTRLDNNRPRSEPSTDIACLATTVASRPLSAVSQQAAKRRDVFNDTDLDDTVDSGKSTSGKQQRLWTFTTDYNNPSLELIDKVDEKHYAQQHGGYATMYQDTRNGVVPPNWSKNGLLPPNWEVIVDAEKKRCHGGFSATSSNVDDDDDRYPNYEREVMQTGKYALGGYVGEEDTDHLPEAQGYSSQETQERIVSHLQRNSRSYISEEAPEPIRPRTLADANIRYKGEKARDTPHSLSRHNIRDYSSPEAQELIQSHPQDNIRAYTGAEAQDMTRSRSRASVKAYNREAAQDQANFRLEDNTRAYDDDGNKKAAQFHPPDSTKDYDSDEVKEIIQYRSQGRIRGHNKEANKGSTRSLSRGNSVTPPAEPLHQVKVIGTFATNSVPTSKTSSYIEANHDEGLLAQPAPKKARMELDHTSQQLKTMSYADLDSEEFDTDPRAAATTWPVNQHGVALTLSQRLGNLSKMKDEDVRAMFYTQKDQERGYTAVWFIGQFGKNTNRLVDLWQERRRIALKYELEVKKRYAAVEAKTGDVEKELRHLKEGGRDLMGKK